MTRPSEPLLRQAPSPSEVAYHLAAARQLRARSIAEQSGRIGRAAVARIRRLGRPSARHTDTDALAEVTFRMHDPLTAIRSSAEILRDNPGLSPAERARFVCILLNEEQRLEGLLAALGPGAPRAAAR